MTRIWDVFGIAGAIAITCATAGCSSHFESAVLTEGAYVPPPPVVQYAADEDELSAGRAIGFTGEKWQAAYAGTSVVVFMHLPTEAEKPQYLAVCNAWQNAFAPAPGSNTGHMDTAEAATFATAFWPVAVKRSDPTATAKNLTDCKWLVKNYDVLAGQKAGRMIHGEDYPALVAWRRRNPAKAIYVSLSRISDQESLVQIFDQWRNTIVTEPSRQGPVLTLNAVKLGFGEFIDQHAGLFVCLFESGKAKGCIGKQTGDAA